MRTGRRRFRGRKLSEVVPPLSKIPTSRKRREKWGTRPVPQHFPHLLQVREVCLELLQVEALGRLFFPIEIVVAEDGVGFLAIRFPETPGHALQRAPGYDGEAARIVGDDGNGVSSPGSGLAVAGRAAGRHRPRLMILRLPLRTGGQLQADV